MSIGDVESDESAFEMEAVTVENNTQSFMILRLDLNVNNTSEDFTIHLPSLYLDAKYNGVFFLL